MGIHNVLEAAVWDMPVIFGPNNMRFQEARGLIDSGGGFEIDGDDTFRELMDRFSSDGQLLKSVSEKAGSFVKGQVGATESILHSVGLG